MNIDDAGHRFGLSSPQYRNAARRADGSLSRYSPEWLAAGYQVLVTRPWHERRSQPRRGVAGGAPKPLFVFGTGQPTTPIRSKPSCAARFAILLQAPHDKPRCRALLAQDAR